MSDISDAEMDVDPIPPFGNKGKGKADAELYADDTLPWYNLFPESERGLS